MYIHARMSYHHPMSTSSRLGQLSARVYMLSGVTNRHRQRSRELRFLTKVGGK